VAEAAGAREVTLADAALIGMQWIQEAQVKRYVIRYEYPGTVNGQPVGTVYALDISDLSPGSWSYSKKPESATLFDSYEQAQKVREKHRWNYSAVVEV
jgi:hypothetical protein